MNLSRDLPPPESAAPLTARRRVPVWLGWWDSWALVGVSRPVTAQDRVQWGRLLPFVLLHLAALPVLHALQGWPRSAVRHNPLAVAVTA